MKSPNKAVQLFYHVLVVDIWTVQCIAPVYLYKVIFHTISTFLVIFSGGYDFTNKQQQTNDIYFEKDKLIKKR